MDDSFNFSEADCYVFGFILNGDGSGSPALNSAALDKPVWLHIDYSESDRIADYVDSLEESISAHEAAVEQDEPNKIRIQVSSLRRQAATTRRYLAPQRDALDALYRQAKNILDQDHVYEIHEQSDRIVRYVEDLDLVRERALVLQEELMNRIAQEQNARMYVLSIVAAVFLPISFLTGLFGMNVAGLPGVEDPEAFLIVAVLMGLTVAGILLYFRNKKWL